MRSHLLLGLVVIFGLSCAPEGRDDSTTDPRIPEEWRHQMAILEGAVEGRGWESEIIASVNYFHRLTGIYVHFEQSQAAILATDETRQDVLAIQEWYESNSGSLMWDESAGTSVLGPPKGRK